MERQALETCTTRTAPYEESKVLQLCEMQLNPSLTLNLSAISSFNDLLSSARKLSYLGYERIELSPSLTDGSYLRLPKRRHYTSYFSFLSALVNYLRIARFTGK